MKNGKQILSAILKTTQLGQTGIRSVLDTSMRPGLRKTLETQLREYDALEREAHSIASRRGWELRDLDPAVRMMTDFKSRMQLRHSNTDSKIASMMIQENTKAMIQGLKLIHQYPESDLQINVLSQKLLDCETANIRQMQPFL